MKKLKILKIFLLKKIGNIGSLTAKVIRKIK